MSVHAIRQERDGREDADHPGVEGWVAVARESVEAIGRCPIEELSSEQLAEGLRDLATLEAQVTAAKLRVLAAADARKVAEESAATGTDAWAARLTGTTRAVMAGGLWLARMLETKYEATRAAFADGGICAEQARVIVGAAETMPAQVSDEQREVAEQALVEKAVNGMDARQLRRAARRMLEVISSQLADEHQADQLKDEEKTAERETWLWLDDNGDGTFSGKFVIPELHGALLQAALERLSCPRRMARNKTGEAVEDETVDVVAGAGESMNWTEWLGAAFVELVEHLPTSGFGPAGATVMVHLDYERLLDGLGAARLDTGTEISAGEARRLACNAGIVPAVLGSRSEPLDLGRETRLHNTPQRRALSITDESCAAEGCQRPFAWCEIHHPHPWSLGGPTDLANALPLCGHHHRRAHDDRYTIKVLPSGELRYRRRRPETIARMRREAQPA